MMGLTPEEEAELRQLEAEDAARRVRNEGTEAVARVEAQRRPSRPASPALLPFAAASVLNGARPLSLYRVTVGGLRDAAQDAIDFMVDVGSFSGPAGRALQVATRSPENRLPTLKGEEQAGGVERFLRGTVSYLVPYSAASKAVGVAKGASWLGRAGRAMLAGGITDFTKDPFDNNLANTLRDTFGIHSDVLDALASEEDDDALYARFKSAVTNAPLGIAADSLFEAGFRTLKAYRAWRGGITEADAAVKAAQADMGLDPKARNLPVPANDVGGELVTPKPKRNTRRMADEPQPEVFNPETHTSTAPPEPKSFEDILDHLKRESGLDVDDEALARLAKNLLDGNPENALAKLGIDPAKLDFSLYDDPDLLGRLQKGLAEVYETIAQRLGRSNQRVTEAEIQKAARSLASTADVLKDIHGNTENLAETLMGARMFVGAHAHKLLSVADEAAGAIAAGAPNKDEAWAAFMEAFHRHAYYLGTLRGAGSEVGRALRSLQMVAKVGKDNAKRAVKEAVEGEAKEQSFGAKAYTEGASTYLSELITDADRLLALDKLRKLEGDVGDLTRHVRSKNMKGLNRIDLALRETVGNLFSSSTAVWNIAAGGSMMGLRGIEKGLLAISKMALSPLGKNYSQAARVQLMEAWGYVDGIASGFRDAYGHTLALLEKEGMAEVAINADSLGFKKLALKAAKLSVEGSRSVGSNFERADVVNDRWFSMSPRERQYLKEKIDSTSAPALLQAGLRGLVDIAGAAVNAAGSLSRAGTILFINAPDQLVGTMAARAGAQAYAVRHAASEAAELGLEGPALSQYLKARAIQLTSEVDGWHPDGFEMGFRESAQTAGAQEAREVLFQDDLELGFDRAMVRGFSHPPLMHMIIPFVKTPLRILERSAIDYTPLGLLKERVRSAILAGGQEGQEAATRISLGLLAMMTALALAEDRSIVGADGGYKSSARLSRPSYSLRMGDDEIEFSRIDPLGTILGFGADIAAYFKQNSADPQALKEGEALVEAALWATTANILSKSWLMSLRNLTDLAGASSDEDFGTRMRRFAASGAARLVPASGAQRTIVKADDFVPEAGTFMEAIMAASIGAKTLPPKRDHLLGREVSVEAWNRLLGIKAGPKTSQEDPLLDELEDLSFDLPAARRSIEGVRLTAAQFSRWLELRGQVVTNEDTGLTLEGTLTELIKLPEYQAMNRAGRVDAMRAEMEGFSRLATDQLLREDDKFAHDVLEKETWDALEIQGAPKSQKVEETARLARELGLSN